jgi:hypothetical protein
MFIVNKQWLRDKKCCMDGFHWIMKQEDLRADKLIYSMLRYDKLDWCIWVLARVLNKKERIKLAIYAAEDIVDIYSRKYPQDYRPKEALKAAKDVLKDDSPENISLAMRYNEKYNMSKSLQEEKTTTSGRNIRSSYVPISFKSSSNYSASFDLNAMIAAYATASIASDNVEVSEINCYFACSMAELSLHYAYSVAMNNSLNEITIDKGLPLSRCVPEDLMKKRNEIVNYGLRLLEEKYRPSSFINRLLSIGRK